MGELMSVSDPAPQTATRPRLLSFLSPLRQRDFALLWAGQSVSRLGDSAYGTVLAWTVLVISNSPAAIGYVRTAASIPQLVLLLVGGLVGDRFSRRAVILVSDVLSGLVVSAVAVLAATGHLTVPILIVLAAVFGAVSAFFLPAYGALIPEIVPEERLQPACRHR
jgi:DHA3 family tetracycline resistance protein-like MFS transporter